MNLFPVNRRSSGCNTALFLSLLMLVSATFAWSDEIVLTDKRKVTGKILEDTSSSLRVRTSKGDLRIPKSRVQSVSKQETGKAESEGDLLVIRQDYYQLAELQFMSGKRPEAAESFLQLLTEDPKNFSKSTKYIVEAYTDPKMKMDHARMQEQLDVALKLDSGSARAWMLKGRIYLDDKETTKAVQALTSALQKDPTLPDAHALRAEAYMQLKDPMAARKDFEAELEHGSTYALHCRLGKILLNGSEYSEALKHFNKAISLDPEQFPALLGRAQAYRLMATSTGAGDKDSRLDDADKDLQAILDKNKSLWEAVLEKGRLLKDKKDYEGAGKHFGDVINELVEKKDLRTPTDNELLAAAYCERGDSNILQGLQNQALDDFNQALKVKPDFALAYNKIGQVSEKAVKYPEAKTNYLKAIELAPGNADYELNVGILCHTYLKQYQEAIDHYQAFVKKGGVDPRVKAWMEQCQLSLKTQ